MNCPKCGNQEWRIEKRQPLGSWIWVFVCTKCGKERPPDIEEREAFE